ncbi:MAG: bifunctional phosphopantothenoylcysteine decarboxylase/phosphopantothenate--cysteine ligase CoaBC [Firmicutes bacterium]|nr:bifunctional phosphopantothenoylcysteine decarboxylase/phosphopantothenate--cysteine ligase CoaBC [Bacillota bacterium]
MLKDKNVLVGVTGGIAAYKTASLVSLLKKQGANVDVIMTKNAQEFIRPLVFETLTGNKCYTDTFERAASFDVEHISLAKKADIAIVAPATANVIAKLACGLADDMLTTTLLACKAKKLIAPAMNTAMLEAAPTQENIKKLQDSGYEIIDPASGMLACGDEGAGKMPEPEVLIEYVLKEIACEKDLLGKIVLVTAGPTQESLDPVRYITNHSSGKMGYAIAKAAMLRGANVTLVSGQTSIEPPMFVHTIKITNTQSMYDAVLANFSGTHFVFKAAAVSDYTPAEFYDDKVKKKDGDMSIPLKRTPDILMELGKIKKPGQFLCGFSMETRDLIENSSAKLAKKNADMIIANNLKDEGSGFKTDTNMITIITKDDVKQMPLMGKFEVANAVIDAALELSRK